MTSSIKIAIRINKPLTFIVACLEYELNISNRSSTNLRNINAL
jgi:hypothetical protein